MGSTACWVCGRADFATGPELVAHAATHPGVLTEDPVALAQQRPAADIAEDLEARELYAARELPWAEHSGNPRAAERARRNDLAEAAVAAARAADEGLVRAVDTPASRAAFAARKAALVEARRVESAEQLAAQRAAREAAGAEEEATVAEE